MAPNHHIATEQLPRLMSNPNLIAIVEAEVFLIALAPAAKTPNALYAPADRP